MYYVLRNDKYKYLKTKGWYDRYDHYRWHPPVWVDRIEDAWVHTGYHDSKKYFEDVEGKNSLIKVEVKNIRVVIPLETVKYI